jgi:glycosyltransferase involved in cell wall biosynthesis
MQHWQKSYLAGAAEAFDLAICNTIVVWRVAEALAERVPTLMYIHEVSILEDILKAEVNARRLVSRLEIWCGSKLAADSLRLLQPAATVVPYGIESIANKPLDQWPSKLPGEKLQIGIFGSIEPRKGQDLAIAALETLPPKVSDLIHLRLYGEDTRSNYSSKLFQSLSNVVTYHGLLEPEEYHRAIVSCDAVLVSSRDDTLPLVSLDALSCGRVLMCTSTTGTSLYLEHGLSGYVAKDATADAISAMLSEAVADRHNWPAVGARGREVFDQNFSKDRFQQIVVQMIERKAAEAA